MKRFSLIAAVLALPLALWMGALALPTLAEDGEDSETETTEEEAVEAELKCASEVMLNGQALLEEHAAFLDTYLQSTEDPTSDQVEIAMNYYRYVEDSLMKVYKAHSDFSYFESGDDIGELYESDDYCESVLEQYLEVNAELLQTFATRMGGGKQAIKALDAMIILNDHLGELQLNFIDTFPGSFNQMNNALPCYAKACIGS